MQVIYRHALFSCAFGGVDLGYQGMAKYTLSIRSLGDAKPLTIEVMKDKPARAVQSIVLDKWSRDGECVFPVAERAVCTGILDVQGLCWIGRCTLGETRSGFTTPSELGPIRARARYCYFQSVHENESRVPSSDMILLFPHIRRGSPGMNVVPLQQLNKACVENSKYFSPEAESFVAKSDLSRLREAIACTRVAACFEGQKGKWAAEGNEPCLVLISPTSKSNKGTRLVLNPNQTLAKQGVTNNSTIYLVSNKVWPLSTRTCLAAPGKDKPTRPPAAFKRKVSISVLLFCPNFHSRFENVRRQCCC